MFLFFSDILFNFIKLIRPPEALNSGACFVPDFNSHAFSVMFLILKRFMCICVHILCAFRILLRAEEVAGSLGTVVSWWLI